MILARNVLFAITLVLAAGATWLIVNQLMARGPQITVDSRTLVMDTLSTIYEAYGLDGEEATYDLLATVATARALEELYLARRDALANTGLETSVQTIHEIELRELLSSVEVDEVAINASWRVIGTVGHASHAHVRGNGYRAALRYNAQLELIAFDLLAIERDSSVSSELPNE